MSPLDVPPHVRTLCERHVDSLEKMEVLAALDGVADKQLTRRVLQQQLQLPTDLMNQCLRELERNGFVAVSADGLVRLETVRVAGAMADLLQLYANDRLAVMRALSDIAMERIRGMTARAFANAFVMRKRKDEDDG